jgi:hypothetical protein
MKYLIVTSINAPTRAMVELSNGAAVAGWKFVVIGDKKSPENYDLPAADYYGLSRQNDLPFEYAQVCPTGHYARKNIGYLVAMCGRADEIMETDDDNIPLDNFWAHQNVEQRVRVSEQQGWVNIYAYFADQLIWPRGYPLDLVKQEQKAIGEIPVRGICCPVHQGLADSNPDVDAVYRLLFDLPVRFRKAESLAISGLASCPFNSQNTCWWPQAYPLMYLPYSCSFRMTDIWRSFVAQRILLANGWGVLFHEATVYQERNEHDLMRDFADEIEGYRHNSNIMLSLFDLPLSGRPERMHDDIVMCYEKLVQLGLVGREELRLLAAWLRDCEAIACSTSVE